MGLLIQEDQSKACSWFPEAGFGRWLASIGPSLWFCSAKSPAVPQEWFGLCPSGAQRSKWASCPLPQWCGPTARGCLVLASLPSPSQPPLWLGLVLTNFLSSVAIPCGQGCLLDLPPLCAFSPHMATVVSARRPRPAVPGHTRNRGLREVKTLAQRVSQTSGPGASLIPCQA